MKMETMFPSSLFVSSSATSQSLLWVGTYKEVQVKKVYRMDDLGMAIRMFVTITNIGSGTINDFFCKITLQFFP
jgi:hypothetical protein